MKTSQERTPTAPEHTYDPTSPNCQAVSGILSRIGDKWSVLLIMQLGDGPRRFNEIKRLIGGISQRMLTLTLRGLERDGLVSRKVTPSIPPRVDYALTELGRDLLGPVKALGDWAILHQPCIAAARAQFDASADVSNLAEQGAETPQPSRVSPG